MNYATDYSKCDTVIHDSVTFNPYLGTEFIMILTILSILVMIFTNLAVILNFFDDTDHPNYDTDYYDINTAILVMMLTLLPMILTILIEILNILQNHWLAF